ncbi:hypothetical protein Tco_0645988 [Tanacetum coccineum]
MEVLTTKIDSQFKDIKGEMKEMREGCNSCGGPHPSSKCYNKPIGGPKGEKANYAYEGYRGNYHDDEPYRPPPARNEHVNAIFTRSGKTYDPPVNPNAKTTIIHDDSEDEADEAEKEVELSSSKQTKSDPPPLKARKIPEQEEEVEDNFKELPLEEKLRIKTSIQDPLTDLGMKPLPKHLEYAYLEKDSLLPVVISALLKDDEKKRLYSILKKYKEAFAWQTSDILGINPCFCKHKINFEDDAKPVIQRQCQLNLNIKEVVKKEIIKLLDAGIIYPIKDSPWVSLVHCVPKKGG